MNRQSSFFFRMMNQVKLPISYTSCVDTHKWSERRKGFKATVQMLFFGSGKSLDSSEVQAYFDLFIDSTRLSREYLMLVVMLWGWRRGLGSLEASVEVFCMHVEWDVGRSVNRNVAKGENWLMGKWNTSKPTRAYKDIKHNSWGLWFKIDWSIILYLGCTHSFTSLQCSNY